MRIATEIRVISMAIMIVSSVLSFRSALAPVGALAMPDQVAWISQTLGLISMPGLGLWAVLAVNLGCPRDLLPVWRPFAAAELTLVAWLLSFCLNWRHLRRRVFTLWVGLSAFFDAQAMSAVRETSKCAVLLRSTLTRSEQLG